MSMLFGKNQMTTFKSGWPTTFYDTLSKVVITMYSKKRRILVGQEKVYDQDLIYGRVIGITISQRSCSTFDTVIYEISPLLWYSAGHHPKWKSRVFFYTFKEYVIIALKLSNVICVFDRYFCQ